MSTWMVVEDEPGIYDLLLAMFEIWGIDGVAFVDGEEALAWIEDADQGRYVGETPELALIDIRLPGLVSGTEVGERLRKSPYLNNVGIILTTAYKMSVHEEQEVRQRADADRLLYKPLPRFDEFKHMLEAVLEERRAKVPAASPEEPSQPPSTDKPLEPLPSKAPPADQQPPADDKPPSPQEEK